MAERNGTSPRRHGNSKGSLHKTARAAAEEARELVSFAKTLELESLREAVQGWAEATAQEGPLHRHVALGAGVAVIGMLSLLLGLFVVLTPATYGVGGWMLYRNKGWRFFQVGVGGARFVALNGVAWMLFGVSLAIQLMNFVLHDPLLNFNAFMLGGTSYVLICAALFAYYPPRAKGQRGATVSVQAPPASALEQFEHDARFATPTFNRLLQNSVIMRTDAKSVSFMWWIFIGMQVSLSVTAFVVTIVASLTASQGNALVRMTTVSLVMWTQAAAVATTHALGGKWRHIETSYAAFQPGRGGLVFIALQIAGWGALGVSIVMGLLVFGSQAVRFQGKTPLLSDHLMAVCGFLGLVAEAFVVASVFYYIESDETDGDVAKSERAADMWSRLFLRVMRMQIATVNLVFGPRDIENITRKPALQDPGAHWACDERWKEAMRLCPRTGDSYLVVGNGFVGKRIVLELLDRGETDVRVFDIVPDSSWDNEPRVSFILGDVTKADQIGPACAGVNTVYSTFAIIRFMERLEHQAFLSYHVNVTGTEVLLEACRSASVARVIVTSSSHATTDEHSAPRFDRDEDAPLLTREEAHNHYGWTKAIADELALKADGSRLENGNELQVVVVRPCSGVFGADDRLSFERVMDIGIAPGVGTKAVMDWVPVQSVVQGHLLAEQALQDGRAGVRGEAFCISNDDPTSMEDFWWLTIKYIRQLPLRQRERLHIDVLYVPEGIFWALAYLSELNAWLFRGKLSLGRDLDMLTPAMLSTATMSYTYSSAKARRVLGYNPVFSLDEAIQRAIHEYSVARGAI